MEPDRWIHRQATDDAKKCDGCSAPLLSGAKVLQTLENLQFCRACGKQRLEQMRPLAGSQK